MVGVMVLEVSDLMTMPYFPLNSSVQHKPYQHACRYHFRRSEGNLRIYIRGLEL